MAEGSEKVMAVHPLIAYPPLKRFIKQEILDDQQELNSDEEENWTLQVQSRTVLIYLFFIKPIEMW